MLGRLTFVPRIQELESPVDCIHPQLQVAAGVLIDFGRRIVRAGLHEELAHSPGVPVARPNNDRVVRIRLYSPLQKYIGSCWLCPFVYALVSCQRRVKERSRLAKSGPFISLRSSAALKSRLVHQEFQEE